MASFNKKTLPQDFNIRNIQQDETRSRSFMVLFMSPNMRRRTIAIMFIWFSVNLIYLSMALNVGYLPGDIFINTTISAALEVPAIVVCIFIVDLKCLGRRLSSAGSCVVLSVFMALCVVFTMMDAGVAVTFCSIIGRSVDVMSYTILVIYTSEIFPTDVRNAALGVAQTFGMFGGMIAPYVGETMARIWAPLPYLLHLTLSVIMTLCCLLLPETLGQPLSDTIFEAENMKSEKKLQNGDAGHNAETQITPAAVERTNSNNFRRDSANNIYSGVTFRNNQHVYPYIDEFSSGWEQCERHDTFETRF